MKRLDGAFYEFQSAELKKGQSYTILTMPISRLRPLKANWRIASFSSIEITSRSERMALSILDFWPGCSCVLLPRSFSSILIHFTVLYRLCTFSMRISLTLGFLSRAISLNVLWIARRLTFRVVIKALSFTIVLHRSMEWQESRTCSNLWHQISREPISSPCFHCWFLLLVLALNFSKIDAW